MSASSSSFFKLNEDDRAQLLPHLPPSPAARASRLVGCAGLSWCRYRSKPGQTGFYRFPPRKAVTAVTSQTERVPSFSSALAWRYSAHELAAIDLIARERLHSCRNDVAWGDLWPSFDPLSFGLRSVMNAEKHASVIAPARTDLVVLVVFRVLSQHCGHFQGQRTIGASAP